ncbi:hypothetical protein ACLB2K_018949 [Fragaria x ananassa]
MAACKASVMALMAVFVVVISLAGVAQAAEAPAPSPVSPAASISPSFVSGLVAAAVALVFGSALRFINPKSACRSGQLPALRAAPTPSIHLAINTITVVTFTISFVNHSLPLHFTELKSFSLSTKTMAGTKAPLMALLAVLIMVISLAGVAQAHEGHAHAPAPATSPAASISPLFVSAFVTAAVALVSGSALMEQSQV